MLQNGNLKGRLMNGVNIKKDELLSTVRENLEKHKHDVKDALELRRKEVFEYFSTQLVLLNTKKTHQPKENIKFPIPQDNSAEYEKVIRMIEMTQEDIIPLVKSPT